MNNDILEKVEQMPLDEKVEMCSGIDFWHLKGIGRLGIPSIMITDGPHGLRKQEGETDHLGLSESIPATCFPTAVTIASSWNRQIAKQVGRALGREAKTENVGVLLGPGVNIKRSPLCGRNFEYFSEDPYLSSEMGLNHVEGVQSEGIGTSLKHFVANNQEHRRMSIDVVIDERTFREIYLASFESVVKKAEPWTVMSSYNKINGEFASQSKLLLTDILRNEWGFKGLVVSDWGGVNERSEGLKAGLDLEMPASYGIGKKKILKAIENNDISESELNSNVERILTVIYEAMKNQTYDFSYDREAHHHFAKKVATEGMILLKNKDKILPLKKEQNIAVIGGFIKQPRYQGSGSSNINPTKIDDIYKEIQKKTLKSSEVAYEQGYNLDDDEIDDELIIKAKNAAVKSDVALLFVGLPAHYESEGYDRTHLQIPENQYRLIEEVSQIQPNIVIVLSNGAPIEMPWLGNVKAVLEGYLGGQAFGGAIADLLFGDANPSGKLAETFPKKLSDNPSYLNFPGEEDKVEYKEGLFVGYRYYDTKGIKPLFPFGYGLSYTTFEYENLIVSDKEIKDTDTVNVSVSIKNTGTLTGKEIVQLYVKDTDGSVCRPEKELKGFEKVELQPNEEKRVTFNLDKRSFAYYNTTLKDWHVESGRFQILLGKSSKEIVLEDTLVVVSTTSIKKQVDRNTTVGDLLSNPLLSSLAEKLLKEANEGSTFFGGSADNQESFDMEESMMNYMPLRALSNFSGGRFTEEMLIDMVSQLNSLQNKQYN